MNQKVTSEQRLKAIAKISKDIIEQKDSFSQFEKMHQLTKINYLACMSDEFLLNNKGNYPEIDFTENSPEEFLSEEVARIRDKYLGLSETTQIINHTRFYQVINYFRFYVDNITKAVIDGILDMQDIKDLTLTVEVRLKHLQNEIQPKPKVEDRKIRGSNSDISTWWLGDAMIKDFEPAESLIDNPYLFAAEHHIKKEKPESIDETDKYKWILYLDGRPVPNEDIKRIYQEACPFCGEQVQCVVTIKDQLYFRLNSDNTRHTLTCTRSKK